MTFLIAAAGTGGHVFPGLSVGEALVDLGVPRGDVLFVGGSRLEARVYPEEGFPFLAIDVRGLQRSLTPKNLRLPGVVLKARKRIGQAIARAQVGVALGMGGYVTIPTALAARKAGIPFFNSEQNAIAGLANRVTARWATRSFASFPMTGGLPDADWVGNPVREPFWSYHRESLLDEARHRFRLSPDVPVLGVFGGSLGAGAINEAVASMLATWRGQPMQVVHLTGESHLERLDEVSPAQGVRWRRVAFEESMELFYAACQLVITRAGGAVAELTATATPSILVPGEFGSAGHQKGNARFLTDAGAAVTVLEPELDTLASVVNETLFHEDVLDAMGTSAERIAKPGAARTIARVMMEST